MVEGCEAASRSRQEGAGCVKVGRARVKHVDPCVDQVTELLRGILWWKGVATLVAVRLVGSTRRTSGAIKQ